MLRFFLMSRRTGMTRRMILKLARTVFARELMALAGNSGQRNGDN